MGALYRHVVCCDLKYHARVEKKKHTSTLVRCLLRCSIPLLCQTFGQFIFSCQSNSGPIVAKNKISCRYHYGMSFAHSTLGHSCQAIQSHVNFRPYKLNSTKARSVPLNLFLFFIVKILYTHMLCQGREGSSIVINRFGGRVYWFLGSVQIVCSRGGSTLNTDHPYYL